MPERMNRRSFTKTTAAIAVAALSSARANRILGANDRIRVGAIGVSNRGGQVMDAFLKHDDAEIVALCDVWQTSLDKAREKIGGKTAIYTDFRKMLERNDIDAVIIATPDHWHAIQMIAACEAGKDVYVEKPLSITVVEGRRMVEAAKRTNRVVQVGMQRRSSPMHQQGVELVQAGKIGRVTVSRAYRLSNMYPDGIGKRQPSSPPADLDWDMWLGPRPERPYQDNIAPYKFRWWQLYSSQVGNWGVHYLDVIRWMLGETAPKSVCAMGGRWAIDDDRTIPDTMEAMFEFASGGLAMFGQYEASGAPMLPKGEVELRGTLGMLHVNPRFLEITPERGGQFQDRTAKMKPFKLERKEDYVGLDILHARNFLDCVKSRKTPNADIETGHRSTTFSLVANISHALGRRLEWDAAAEKFTNCNEANTMLHYEYRRPWTLG